MWNKPGRQTLNSLPKLYSTEEIPLEEKLIQLHFYIGNTDFYIIEYDGKNTFWGFVILNGDTEMAEFGCIDFQEIKSIKVNGWQEIDCDLYWQMRPANQVDKICIAQRWKSYVPVSSIEIECPGCKRTIMADSDSSEVQCNNCKIIVLQRHFNPTENQGGLQWRIHQS